MDIRRSHRLSYAVGLLFFVLSAQAQVIVITDDGAVGGAPPGGAPYSVDFTGYSTGNLVAHADWVTGTSDGDDVKITNGTGAYNNEDNWSLKSVRYSGGAMSGDDMIVYAILGAEAAYGAGFGVGARMDASGNGYFALYQDNSELLELHEIVSGTPAAITNVSQAMSAGDTLKLVVSNDTCYVYYNSTVKITQYDASLSTGTYAGMGVSGDGSTIEYTDWYADDWP
jgi:hypothetical protein